MAQGFPWNRSGTGFPPNVQAGLGSSPSAPITRPPAITPITASIEGNTLRLALEASTSKPTPVSLSAHPYFNLAGVPAVDIFGHEITIA
ncbi:MAG TPA: hypothetical protein VHY78_09555, partial [Stellaceae bacterium]|nr:hypothetical protein [Stellaceae bacterium]